MKKFIIILLMLFSIVLFTPVLADELDNGVIQGKIINGTEDGGSVAGVDINLRTYLNREEINSSSQKTDPDGRFTFEDLSVQPDYIYQATLIFDKAEYFSEPIILTDNETTKSIDFFVYDSNSSDGAIRVTTGHTVVYIRQGGLQIKEFYVFSNDSDMTYVGVGETENEKNRETLMFYLPDEATGVDLTTGLTRSFLKDIEDGFVDTLPVLPGAKEVAFSYFINHSSDDYTLSQKIFYPAKDFHILVQEGNIKVSSDQLSLLEPMTIAGNNFIHLSGTNISAGTNLVVHISGLSNADTSSSAGTGGQKYLYWALIILAVFAGGFSFVYILSKKRRIQPVKSGDENNLDRQMLISEIAQLDDDFEDNKTDEESYRQRRAEKKAQLTALMNASEEIEDSQ